MSEFNVDSSVEDLFLSGIVDPIIKINDIICICPIPLRFFLYIIVELSDYGEIIMPCWNSFILYTVIGRPENVRLTRAVVTDLSFSWDELSCGSRGFAAEGDVLYHYELVQLSDGLSISNQQTSLTTVDIRNLRPSTGYRFRVTVVNGINQERGVYSDTLTAFTAGIGTYVLCPKKSILKLFRKKMK